MTNFMHYVQRSAAASLATFGDSITEGMSTTAPQHRWANRLAATLGIRLYNKGIAGTTMQGSPMATGEPRPNNGHSRFERDLLGAERADVIAILYGFNDARYVGAPETFNLDGFIRDYRDVLTGLLNGGYAPDALCLGSPPHIPDAGFSVGTEGFTGQSRTQFQVYVEAVRALAEEFGTFYAPVNERMGMEGGDALISADFVHPNDAGHAKIAEVFAAAMRIRS